MKHRFSCRVCASLLCILVFFSAVLSRPAALNVRAASLALGDAALNEMSMVLWNLLINAMVACGVSTVVPDDTSSGTISTPIGSYDAEAALYEALIDYYHVSAVSSDMVFTLQNGRTVTLDELLELTGWDTVGTGARRIPSEETWQRFRVIQGGSGSPDKDPQFTQLVSFVMDAGVLLGISKFVESLQAGEVEGLDAADYFPDGFDGTLPRDAEGNYIVTGYISGFSYGSYTGTLTAIPVDSDLYNTFVLTPVVAYFTYKQDVSGMPDCRYVEFLTLKDGAVVLYPVPAQIIYHRTDGDRKYAQTTSSFHADYSCRLTVPVFSSRAAASLFLQSDEFTGCENALQYDPSALPDALPDSFAPLTGTELDPSVFNALFPALVSALQTAFPQPQPNPDPDAEPEPVSLPDPVAGTATFNKTVADTVADVAPEAVPNPDPDVQPDTDIDSYKVNLTNIFPFCLPFDFIHLLEALDAKPVTPCFDFPFVVPALEMDITLQLDLSMFNDFMEIFRLCETVSFIVMLIFITPKLIRW